MKSYGKVGFTLASLFLVFIFGVPFLSAYYPFFIFNQETFSTNVSSLITFNQSISISPDPSIVFQEGEEPYNIKRVSVCNNYDNETGDCIDSAPDLCPYISLTPNDGEAGDVALALNASFPDDVANGQINLPSDSGDSWTLAITPACFEGECPNGYDAFTYGNPLPAFMKGATFQCDLQINSSRPPVLTRGFGVKYAEASLTKTLHVSAIIQPGEPPTPTIDPVIIIPGIMGSAYKNGELVIDPILHTYDDLVDTLEANGYTEGIDLFTMPYEWRDSNLLSANILRNKINSVKQICSCSKVDLVAHSMGGLVAREYIQSAQYGHDVDQLIFLGTPHKGSPKAYLQWEAGQNDTDFSSQMISTFFEAEALRNGYVRIFDYIRNRPVLSVQELLPTFDYIKDKNTGVLRTYPNNYPRNPFLESLDINIENLLNSGVRITNIVGNSGSNTIEKIRVVPAVGGDLWQDGKPDGWAALFGDNGLERGVGDDTVTTLGATLDNSISNQEIHSEHQRLPVLSESKIFHILTGKTATTTFDHNYGVDVKVLMMQLLSPVDFVVTAPDGKKMGKNFSNGQEYNEIPNAFYSGYQTDSEYITILNPLDGQYKVELQGTGSGGKYTLMTNYISDATSTEAIFTSTTTPNQVNTLQLQVNNDNPGNISLDPDIISDINTAYNKGWIKDKKIRDALLLQTKLLIRFDKKTNTIIEKLPNGSKKQKKVEKVVKVVDKVLAKLVLKQLNDMLKKKQITQEGYNLLKIDLDWIINH